MTLLLLLEDAAAAACCCCCCVITTGGGTDGVVPALLLVEELEATGVMVGLPEVAVEMVVALFLEVELAVDAGPEMGWCSTTERAGTIEYGGPSSAISP